MHQTLTLSSPAKLNLFLHVNGRLDNGYHELQSLFHFIDLSDTMTFTTTDGDECQLTCNIKELESSDNLIIQAVNALLPYKSSSHIGLNIHLHKVLPMGGGVGGGSSNAATTLLALNNLWQLNLTLEKLAEIGNTLGADVPIFIFGQSAIAEGTGDKLYSYPIKEKWYLVLTPAVHINTAKLFGNVALPRNTKKIPNSQVKYSGLDDNFKNDFQTLVYKEYPAVAKALDWLLEYAPARLTGTGACVFAEFETQSQAQKIHNLLPADLSGFVAKGSNQSATHKQLSELIGQ